MNKQELTRLVAADAEVTQRDAGNVIDSLLRIIQETVAQGDKVQLMGFGLFESRRRAPRTARNPRTNEPLLIPETMVPVFKPGREFKEAVEP